MCWRTDGPRHTEGARAAETLRVRNDPYGNFPHSHTFNSLTNPSEAYVRKRRVSVELQLEQPWFETALEFTIMEIRKLHEVVRFLPLWHSFALAVTS